MTEYLCKVKIKSYTPFSFLKWDAEFNLNGDTDDVPEAYVPKHFASAENFLSNQAISFGKWIFEAVNGLKISDGEVAVYDPDGNVIWEKKVYTYTTPPSS